ncbi:hypothetical protein AVEN_39867-1 [Araneus ventricosus]|uniref:Uncharacterized protein n=1 Tax=Araneus ventricosus TaxID=182803 RepID=A0A4Y2NI11_ARAVE|nr:hypothetical protein AVEN_39867-1 [Araneus ventricosus]
MGKCGKEFDFWKKLAGVASIFGEDPSVLPLIQELSSYCVLQDPFVFGDLNIHLWSAGGFLGLYVSHLIAYVPYVGFNPVEPYPNSFRCFFVDCLDFPDVIIAVVRALKRLKSRSGIREDVIFCHTESVQQKSRAISSPRTSA